MASEGVGHAWDYTYSFYYSYSGGIIRLYVTPTAWCGCCCWQRLHMQPCRPDTQLCGVCCAVLCCDCVAFQAKPAGGFSFGSAPAFGASSQVIWGLASGGVYFMEICHGFDGGGGTHRLSRLVVARLALHQLWCQLSGDLGLGQ